MNKITSLEAMQSAYNAAKGQLALRCVAAHDINSPKKDILCCGGTGCHASNAQELMDNLNKYIKENGLENDVRVVLHLKPSIAPIKASILPLSKKLGDKAMELRDELAKHFMVDYDDTGSIGKRYRRADEIGTPYCVTVDFDTVGDPEKGVEPDNAVTIRDRDTMEQVRVPISELKNWLAEHIG